VHCKKLVELGGTGQEIDDSMKREVTGTKSVELTAIWPL